MKTVTDTLFPSHLHSLMWYLCQRRCQLLAACWHRCQLGQSPPPFLLEVGLTLPTEKQQKLGLQRCPPSASSTEQPAPQTRGEPDQEGKGKASTQGLCSSPKPPSALAALSSSLSRAPFFSLTSWC